MSVGSMWAIASDDEASALLSDETEVPTLFLDDIGELEMMALATCLGVPYEPALVHETSDGEVVIRLPEALLKKLAGLDENACSHTAAKWHETAETLVDRERDEIEEQLSEMAEFAKKALAGSGVLSVPTF